MSPTRSSVPVPPIVGFEVFFETERPRLFRALVLLTLDAHEAEELMHGAFLKVWERWWHVRDLEDPTGYLYRTAMNGFRSNYRRALLAAKRVVRLTPSRDPLDPIAARDEALRELARLTPRQRAAVVLTELLGHSFEQAGRELGIKPGTARLLVSQASARLSDPHEARDG